jgi:CDP-glucose 4,6-dehydratase
MGVRQGAVAHLELESAMLSSNWSGRRVFLTGHTGFKGAWMTVLLNRLGAEVAGYALAPPSEPNLFTVARVGELAKSRIADIRDAETLTGCLGEFAPDVVFHMAAQSLVRESYRAPVETFDVNVLGTVQVLEAVRKTPTVKAVVVLTSDKSYENRETLQPYRESDPMGGHDPYSASKGCAELATAAYGRSFFQPGMKSASIASVRAGNVVGGGDWAKDRLMADIVRGLIAGEDIVIRRPDAVRPWQHVLEPLHGYLRVAEHLLENGPMPWEAWNFGPDAESEKPVEAVARLACQLWGRPGALALKPDPHAMHEATLLKLDSSKARERLGWRPRWNFAATMRHTLDWYRNFSAGNDMRAYTAAQIDAYRNLEEPA